MIQSEQIDELNKISKGLSAFEIIKLAQEKFHGRLTFATSLGEEDQVLLDIIAKASPSIEVFTLDTGRLFQESYDLMGKNMKKYKLNLRIYSPETRSVEKMVNQKGINLFYESIENRKLCCNIRKIEPLKRALRNSDAWITGLRKQQSVTRTDIQTFEWDALNGKIKINPLMSWTMVDVKNYIKENKVDVNVLHAKGFISIGCAPCTRPVNDGEDVRAGRWWWESPEQKECGLHNNPNRPIKKIQ